LYTEGVEITWDPEKAASNFKKHGVHMAEGVPVLDDPTAITVTDDESDATEQRFVTIGTDGLERVLVVVYTWRGDDIRLISVRTAEPHEREEYENQ
jgi:uncharacterized DUF497 family protein